MDTCHDKHMNDAIERNFGRVKLILSWERIGKDYCVKLSGGTAHVGAVALGIFDSISGRASSSVITAPGHREDELALKGARKISQALLLTTVFIVGIHIDAISKKEIDDIISTSEDMIDELCCILRER